MSASRSLPGAGVHGAVWRSSSRSQTSNCVEVAAIGDGGATVALRDSKDRRGPMLVFGRPRWTDFLTGAKDGVFLHRTGSG